MHVNDDMKYARNRKKSNGLKHGHEQQNLFATDNFFLAVKETSTGDVGSIWNIDFSPSFDGNKWNCCRRKATEGELILLMAKPAVAGHQRAQRIHAFAAILTIHDKVTTA